MPHRACTSEPSSDSGTLRFVDFFARLGAPAHMHTLSIIRLCGAVERIPELLVAREVLAKLRMLQSSPV